MSNSSFVVVRPFPGSRSDRVAGAFTFSWRHGKASTRVFRSSPKNHRSTFGLEKARPLCPGGGSKKWALISLTNMQVNPVVLQPITDKRLFVGNTSSSGRQGECALVGFGIMQRW